MKPSIGIGPFGDLRILELSTGIAGRTAGMLLAEFGAEVARVLPPGGQESPDDPRSLCWDRGKILAEMDQADPRAIAELRRLVDACDVLLTDVGPDELDRLGLDAATALERSPGLVHVWLPPYGARGRWSTLPEDPLLLAALGGFAAHHPATEDQPVAPVVPTVNYLQGALGATAVAAALVGRATDGAARAVTVTGLHAMAAAQGTMMLEGLDVDRIYAVGKILGGAPNFRAYQARDGQWLYLAALTPDFFFRALDVLGRMEVLVRTDVAGEFTNILVPETGQAVGAELAAVFAERPRAEWLRVLADAGVPAAPVSRREDWMASEVVSANDARVDLDHPTLGPVVLPGVPVALSATPGTAGVPPSGDRVPASALWRATSRAEAPVGRSRELPLTGLRVLDLSTFLAGPFAGSLLADHGAEVVKVEAPGGDPYRTYSAAYTAVNQAKSGITLDLRRPQGRDALLRLVTDADVLVDNLRPGSLDRLGLGAEILAAANPALVRCSVSAYGRTGAWADQPGFDPVVQALSGLMAAQGGAGAPVATTAPVHDATTGTLAAFGVLAALLARTRTGRGQHVTTSLAAASTFLQSAELTSFAGRPPTAEGGRDFPGPTAYHRLYRAEDGWLATAATTPAQRHALLRALGQDDPSTADDDEGLAARLEDVLATRPADEWVDVLGAHEVPACRVLSAEAELHNPFLVENDFSHVVDDPVLGRLRVVRSYAEWRESDPPRPPAEIPGPPYAEVWRDRTASSPGGQRKS
ncbi:MAG: L-carnitine dehydratase/bile acid-inducible protein [Actinoallomurus sp.]|nr:L-carnitine dehydratase/bile acid-inducible protein [Actinoallomurus sp.]